MKTKAYLVGQSGAATEGEADGKLGHSPSAAWLGPGNQSTGAMPQGGSSQPSPDVQTVVTFNRRGLCGL